MSRQAPARTRNALIVVVVTVLVVVGGLLAVQRGSVDPEPSGSVTWASGVFPGNGIDRGSAQSFGDYRHCSVGVAAVFSGAKTWDQLAHDDWYLTRYKNFPGRLSIGVPLTLQKMSLGQVSAGAADATFRSFAQQLIKTGRASSDIRLGWEFNGDWQPWSAFNAREFINAFRHVSTLLKSLLPRATMDWNGNVGVSQSGHNVFTELYPGDDVVDVVGVDVYDQSYAHADSAEGFQAWAGTPFGLNAWYAFAQQHHKKLALPEWGLNAAGGGDNPAFIRGMYWWLQQRSAGIDFEAYFNWSKGTLKNSLHDPVQMPRSSAVYAQLWGGGQACTS